MINGIKALKFGVEDVAKAVQYLQDFGLSEVKNALNNAHCFRTQNGAEVQVYSVDDERLPADLTEWLEYAAQSLAPIP